MKTTIIIPARYGSTRLPGKPLAMIAGQTMLQRVVRIAQAAAAGDPEIQCLVATDDERIGKHADEIGVPWVMTPVRWVLAPISQSPRPVSESFSASL